MFRRGITLSVDPSTPSGDPCVELKEDIQNFAESSVAPLCAPPPSPIDPPLSHGKFGTISRIEEDPTKLLKQARVGLYVQKEVCDTWALPKLKKLFQEYKKEKAQVETFQTLRPSFPLYLPDLGKVQECREAEGALPIVRYLMEKVEGETFINFLNSQKESPNYLETILGGFIQAFYFLLFSNLQGYFHNDIKLDNLMLRIWKGPETVILPSLVLATKELRLTLLPPLRTPVFIDYAFSKRIAENFFPLEAFKLVAKFYAYFSGEEERSEEDNYLLGYFRDIFEKIPEIYRLFPEAEMLERMINEPRGSIASILETLPPVLETPEFGIKMVQFVENLWTRVAGFPLHLAMNFSTPLRGGGKTSYKEAYLKYKLKYLLEKRKI